MYMVTSSRGRYADKLCERMTLISRGFLIMTIAAFASPSTSSDESSSTTRFDYDYESQNQSQNKEDLPARSLDEVTVTIG